MPAYLTASPARRSFKSLLGNANHRIITILVGLDAIERGEVNKVPKGLGATWSPKNFVASARLSRRMVLDLVLVRSVDALDVYFRHINRKPCLVQSPEIQSLLSENDRSVFKKFEVIEKKFPDLSEVYVSLVALMITWRNRSVHSEDDKNLKGRYRQCIEDNLLTIEREFRSLDGNILLGHFDKFEYPKLKEVTSLINATHHYVAALEKILFKTLSPDMFLKELVWKGLLASNDTKGNRDGLRKQMAGSIWGKTGDNKVRSIKGFLRQQSLAFDQPNSLESAVIFGDDLLDSLYSKTPKKLLEWVNPAELSEFK